MPRIAKDKENENELINKKKTATKKRTSTKKVTDDEKAVKKSTSKKVTDVEKSAKKVASKKVDADEKAVKKSTSKKVTDGEKTVKKSSSEKASDDAKPTKRSSSKKSSDVEKIAKKADDTEKESTTAKKSSSKATSKTSTKSTSTSVSKRKTSTTKKTSTQKKTTKKSLDKNESPVQVLEYYDLPLKYGNTIIRLLAQTPKTLFVYWEVADTDIENFKKNYGDDFFQKTTPILIVHNLTLNKSYEVEINDFANCWYLNTEDSDCKYDIELGRKYINSANNTYSQNDYDHDVDDILHIVKSNDLQTPNDHILFEKLKEFVIFRNVNDDTIIKKNIKSFKFLKDIYKFYKDMYDEDILKNPSSQFKF